MVKITNGKVNYTVAKSVYESIFKKRGFKIIGGADDGLQERREEQKGEKGEEVELTDSTYTLYMKSKKIILEK